VGSGKTVVAFLSMLAASGSGCQAALMAPTEILAQQHYRNLQARP
jgi:ATP-dependent DNA helicase RecG